MDLQKIQKLSDAAEDRGKPFRVLVVDDEKWVREVFLDFCQVTKAFEVDLAANGSEGLEKLESAKAKYDLITLDLIMPEMSGIEVLQSIKAASPQTPVMIITGNATEKLVNEAGVMGACRVMYKPITLDDFLSEVASALIKPVDRNE